MVALIPRIASAIAAGESANDALQAVLLDNRLDSRLQALSQPARQLVRELIGLGGVSTLPLNPLYGVLSLSGQQLLDAQGEVTEQRIAVELGGVSFFPQRSCFWQMASFRAGNNRMRSSWN
jgi:hypothetical protein